MRTLLLTLIVILGIGHTSLAQYENDLTLYDLELSGKVKELTSKEFEVKEKNGKIKVGKVYKWNKSSFNDQGNLIAKSRYDSKGNLLSSYSYVYDGNDNLIRVDYKSNEDETYIDQKYDYNSDGQLIHHYFMNKNEEITSSTELFYNQNGNKIEEIWKDGTFLKKRVEYAYDENDNIIERREYDSNDEFYKESFFKYDYDKDGNILMKYIVKKDGTVTHTCGYKKSEAGENQKVECTNGKGATAYTYTYDLNGIPSKTKHGNYADEILEIEKDKEGNWTSKTFKRMGKTLVHETREISYY